MLNRDIFTSLHTYFMVVENFHPHMLLTKFSIHLVVQWFESGEIHAIWGNLFHRLDFLYAGSYSLQGYFQAFLSTTIFVEKIEFCKKSIIFSVCIFAPVNNENSEIC